MSTGMTPAQTFEAHVMPCLDAGFNLARWLLRDEAAAEDVLQEASLRAFRYIASARLDEIRPWFLKIVRNCCFTHLEKQQGLREVRGVEDDELDRAQWEAGQVEPSPEERLTRQQKKARIDAAIRALPPPLREVLILREIEGLDYEAIAEVASIPIGTVMSRLSRARAKLRTALTTQDV